MYQVTLHMIGIFIVHPQLLPFPKARCCSILLRQCLHNDHVHLSLFNCAVIWFIKWTHKVWGFLLGLGQAKIEVRTSAKIDNVRTFCSFTWKELRYFINSKHSSKQGPIVATEIQRIMILNYIEFSVNLDICYRHICWKFL